jgi:hypothetical protein
MPLYRFTIVDSKKAMADKDAALPDPLAAWQHAKAMLAEIKNPSQCENGCHVIVTDQTGQIILQLFDWR